MSPTFALLATPPMPGAVAVIELAGPGAAELLTKITGVESWERGVVRLTDFSGIDQGLAALLDDQHAQLMPHAGPRVVQRMMARLIELGATAADAGAALEEQDIESAMRDALWRAPSPAAIDLLLAQPRLWKQWLADEQACRQTPAQILEYSARLDRLLKPASVAVVGSPNVGKSTLTNAVLGQNASIVADMPGTTRDFVTALAEFDGVALRWFDTPGVRVTPDPIESEAIALARHAIIGADVLVVVRDGETGWPGRDVLPRTPDLYVVAKADRGGAACAGDPPDVILTSSHTGAGLDTLLHRVLGRLGLSRVDRAARPWAFSPSLRRAVAAGDHAVRELLR